MNIFALLCVLPSIFSLAINVLNKKFLDEFKSLFPSYKVAEYRINENVLLREFIWLNRDQAFKRRNSQYLNARRRAIKKRSNDNKNNNQPNRRCGVVVIKEIELTKKYSTVEFSPDLVHNQQEPSKNTRFAGSYQYVLSPIQEKNFKNITEIKSCISKNVVKTSVYRKSIITRRNTFYF